jgi:hypothetical protein
LLEWRDAGGPVYGVRMALEDLIDSHIRAFALQREVKS